MRSASHLACVVFLGLAVAGCQSVPKPRPAADLHRDADSLAGALSSLGPLVDPLESERAARVLVSSVETQRLAVGLDGGAWGRNVAVNLGFADWGLCWQWAELLGRRLHQENLRTLNLHWACAHSGSSLREHNALVITAQGRPFHEGLVIDPWRRGGRISWASVTHDRYPWRHEPGSEARWKQKDLPAATR